MSALIVHVNVGRYASEKKKKPKDMLTIFTHSGSCNISTAKMLLTFSIDVCFHNSILQSHQNEGTSITHLTQNTYYADTNISIFTKEYCFKKITSK